MSTGRFHFSSALVVSLLLHLVVLGIWISQSPATRDKRFVTRPSPVQAHLYFAKPAAEYAPPPDQPAIVSQNTPDAAVAPVQRPTPAQQADQAQLAKDNDQAQAEAQAQANSHVTEVSNNTNAVDLHAMGRALANRQAGALQQLTEQAVLQRQQAALPSMNDVRRGDDRTAQEKALQAKIIHTDCNKAANKAVSLLTGLLGGMVRCSTNPDIGSFIEQRLERNGIQSDKDDQHSSASSN